MEIGFERLDQPASLDLHPVVASVGHAAESTLLEQRWFRPEPAFWPQPAVHLCSSPAIE